MERVGNTGGNNDGVAPWTYTTLEADAWQSFIKRISTGQSGKDRVGELDAVFVEAMGTLVGRLQVAYAFPTGPFFKTGVPTRE